jgi:HK97 family phage prohead protease
MRSIRGLYVIRSGGAAPVLTATARADAGDESDPAAAPEDGRLATLQVDFSRFNTWYEIDSWWEGRFLEQTKRGAFKRTIEQRGNQVKVLFNHGFDFNIGDKVLGVPEVLEERDASPHLEAGLLDTSYNRDLLPGLRAGAYGSSFMFEVVQDQWNHEPDKSDYNPEGIPERTITEVKLYEAGPVTWPANPDATSGVRSGTDWMLEQLQRRDPDLHEDLVRSLAGFRAAHGLRTLSSEGTATPSAADPKAPAPGVTPARHVDGISRAARAHFLRALTIDEMAGHK